MAVTIYKTFVAGEVLTATDLNQSFLKLLDNGEDLAWPATTSKDLNGNELILDADADTSFHASTDDVIDIRVNGVDVNKVSTGGIAGDEYVVIGIQVFS